MKKIISLIVISFFVFPVFGQSEKQEVYITAGLVSGPFLVESFNNIDFFSTEYRKDHVAPIITIGYQYRLSKKIKLGPEIIFDRFWIENKENSYHFNSFLCNLSFTWFERKKVSLYSGLSAGITFKRAWEKDNGIDKLKKDKYLGLHLYTICFDYKFPNFTITVNKGIGMSGLLNIGMKYRFKK